jgi:cation diffusion facilitator family transporter
MSVQSDKERVALLSVFSNSVLTLMKLAIGVISGSISIVSEAVHSGVDLLASVIAFISVRISGKPSDREHPYGHGKVENISGTVEAVLIFLAAGWIIWEASRRLIHPAPLDNLGWGVGVMFVSSVANVVVSRMLMKVGKATDSAALIADAWHLRTDVWTSAGVMVGIALIWISESLLPGAHFHRIDSIAALVVAILIIRAAYRLTIEAGRDLLDVRLPEDEEELIRAHILGYRPEVYGFHKLLTRKSGATRFIEFHILVDSRMSVEESHRINDLMTEEIEEHLAGSHITIHVEPCDGLCLPSCSSDCMMSEEEREFLRREIRTKKEGNSEPVG